MLFEQVDDNSSSQFTMLLFYILEYCDTQKLMASTVVCVRSFKHDSLLLDSYFMLDLWLING